MGSIYVERVWKRWGLYFCWRVTTGQREREWCESVDDGCMDWVSEGGRSERSLRGLRGVSESVEWVNAWIEWVSEGGGRSERSERGVSLWVMGAWSEWGREEWEKCGRSEWVCGWQVHVVSEWGRSERSERGVGESVDDRWMEWVNE